MTAPHNLPPRSARPRSVQTPGPWAALLLLGAGFASCGSYLPTSEVHFVTDPRVQITLNGKRLTQDTPLALEEGDPFTVEVAALPGTRVMILGWQQSFSINGGFLGNPPTSEFRQGLRLETAKHKALSSVRPVLRSLTQRHLRQESDGRLWVGLNDDPEPHANSPLFRWQAWDGSAWGTEPSPAVSSRTPRWLADLQLWAVPETSNFRALDGALLAPWLGERPLALSGAGTEGIALRSTSLGVFAGIEWRNATGPLTEPLLQGQYLHDGVFSPDGQTVLFRTASWSDSFFFWDLGAQTWTAYKPLSDTERPDRRLLFTPHGSTLLQVVSGLTGWALLSGDPASLENPAAALPLLERPGEILIQPPAFSPEGQLYWVARGVENLERLEVWPWSAPGASGPDSPGGPVGQPELRLTRSALPEALPLADGRTAYLADDPDDASDAWLDVWIYDPAADSHTRLERPE